MNPGSSLYKDNEDKIKKQTAAYVARSANLSSASKEELAVIKTKNDRYFKNLNRLSNDKLFGSLTLELNQSNSMFENLGRATKWQITAPGIHQITLFVQLPDDNNVDTLYNAVLYLGNWPIKAGAQMLAFRFAKNIGNDPVIENMIIKISGFHYHELIQMIKRIDWTRLEALIKN